MTFTFTRSERLSCYGYIAWGMGLSYRYNADRQNLTIIQTSNRASLKQLELDEAVSKSSLTYIEILEKTLQIKALVLSNYNTINITDIFADERLYSLVNAALITSRHAFDLRTRKFKRFATEFSNQHNLSSVKISRNKNPGSGLPYYYCSVKTANNNVVTERSCSLYKIFGRLSEKVAHELLSEEFFLHGEASAYSLIEVSSKFALIGNILNSDFIPAAKIKGHRYKHAGVCFEDETYA